MAKIKHANISYAKKKMLRENFLSTVLHDTVLLFTAFTLTAYATQDCFDGSIIRSSEVELRSTPPRSQITSPATQPAAPYLYFKDGGNMVVGLL